jgi:UDP-N-acetylglucosamine acyltransferase
MIHPTAIIDKGAQVGDDVEIGAYSFIGDKVVIGNGCEIGHHVTIEGNTVIGAHTMISQFAAIGGPPQDLSYRGEDTRLVIGDRVRIREYVTVHRGTVKGGALTTIGDDCFLMAYCHVAHDCKLGQGVIMANCAHLGGHIELGARAILGGIVAVHQFVRVGEYALVGGQSGVAKDVPPYSLASGPRIYLYGLNEVGLRRNGFSRDTIRQLKKAFKTAFRSGLKISEAVERIKAESPDSPEALIFAEFLKTSKRGVARVSLSRHAFRAP